MIVEPLDRRSRSAWRGTRAGKFGRCGAGLLGVLCAAVAGNAEVPVQPVKADPAALTAPLPAIAQVYDALERNDPARAAELVQPLAESGNADAQFVLGLLADIGAGVRLDHAGAARWLEKAAGQGNQPARSYLAWKYRTGFGFETADPAAAARWSAELADRPVIEASLNRWLVFRDGAWVPKFSRALVWMMDQADKGNGLAQANLAQIYLATEWTIPDPGKHLDWLQQAAKRHDPPSLELLADYYAEGTLVPRDQTQALGYRLAAAEAGSATAQYALGKQYEDGDGVEENAAQAARWYRSAVRQDNTEAMVRLVTLLRNGASGLPQDFAEAVRLAQRGAELGDAQAMVNLADLYNRGEGVPQDYAKSAQLYREAAAKGLVRAMTMLGWLMAGDKLGPPDYVEALHWYEQAAAKGSEFSMIQAGQLYENGQGVEKDLPKAFEWYERAARAGDGQAQVRVAGMLREGRGIARDHEEAVAWLQLAAKNGEPWGEASLGLHYLRGLGVKRDLREAFTHLAIAMRQLDDKGTTLLLVELLLKSSPEERAGFRDLFQACMEDPLLPEAKGPLPETCFQAIDLVLGKDAYAITAPFLQRLAMAHRPKAASLLAWHAFTGRGMPYDLTKAREWARAAAAVDPRESAYLLAGMDSVAAESPADRAAARENLRKLADEGYGQAAFMLAYRCAVGEGEALDPAAALHYYNLSYDRIPEKKTDSIEVMYQALHITLPKPAPSEAEVAETILKLAAAGPDSRPRPIYQPPPYFPSSLTGWEQRGEVDMEFIIDTTGRVRDLQTLKSTHPLFTAAAETAVSQWRFAPGRKAGKPANVRVRIPLAFALDESPAKVAEPAAPTPTPPPSSS